LLKKLIKPIQAGAAIIHVHARHDDGTPTQDKNRYEAIIKAIRARCHDVIIQPSTGGAVGMSREQNVFNQLI
jgi:3-keto-5-aminohexanoate cleavage enzyme